MIRETEPTTERIRTPELSKKASEYIAAIEAASPESPVSLDVLVDGGDIMNTLAVHLAEIDKLYSCHDELFFKDGRMTPCNEFDYEAMAALSHEVLRKLEAHTSVYRAAGLGLAVLQFAEAGSRAARDPSLLIAADYNKQDLPKVIANTGGDLAKQAFDAFQGHLRGDIHKLPLSRLGYIGCLIDTHYGFWTGVTVKSTSTQEMREEATYLLSLFPAKVAAWDTHSSYGRPSPATAREGLYVQAMKEFKETLETGEAAAWDPYGNTRDAISFVLEVLEVAMAQGYSPDESLQIATHNSAVMGRITERRRDGMPIDGWDVDWMATVNRNALWLEDDKELPRLVIDETKLAVKNLSPDQVHKQQVRSQKAGACPARNPVLLKPQGTTHQNIQIFLSAMRELIGVEPPILQYAGDKVYVDPAALTISYVLYTTAINYYTKG